MASDLKYKELARLNISNIILACRNYDKAVLARAKIKREVNTSSIISAYGGFDMNSLEAISKATKRLEENHIDVVFLNAGGVVFSNRFETVTANETKYEKTIFQNSFFASFYLYKELKVLDLILKRELFFPVEKEHVEYQA